MLSEDEAQIKNGMLTVLQVLEPTSYCSFAYYTLASFRTGISGSASFQRAKKSWYAAWALVLSPASTYALPSPKRANAPVVQLQVMPRWSISF